MKIRQIFKGAVTGSPELIEALRAAIKNESVRADTFLAGKLKELKESKAA